MTLDEAILEKWCKVNDFPNYSISSWGRVRNDITGHILSIRHDKNGYRKHLSESHSGKKSNRGISVICIETGQKYQSIREAAEDMGILRTSICNMLSGYSENARGYHFRKVVKI